MLTLLNSCSKNFDSTVDNTPNVSIAFDNWKILPQSIGSNYGFTKMYEVNDNLYFFSRMKLLGIDKQSNTISSVKFGYNSFDMSYSTRGIHVNKDFFAYSLHRDIYVRKISNPKTVLKLSIKEFDTTGLGYFHSGQYNNSFHLDALNNIYFKYYDTANSYNSQSFKIIDSNSVLIIQKSDTFNIDAKAYWNISKPEGKYFSTLEGTFLIDEWRNKQNVLPNHFYQVENVNKYNGMDYFFVRDFRDQYYKVILAQNGHILSEIVIGDSTGNLSGVSGSYFYRNSIYFHRDKYLWEFDLATRKIYKLKGLFADYIFDMYVYSDKMYLATTTGVYFKDMKDLRTQ